MQTLIVGVGVFKKTQNPLSVFFVERQMWIDGTGTVETIIAYSAKSAGSDVVLSKCECDKRQINAFVLSENVCDTDDDAIAMSSNAV